VKSKGEGMSKKHKDVDRELDPELVAESAIDYLEHMRVEHGCETTLHLIGDAACLTREMHEALHGSKLNQTELLNLEENILKVAKASPLDTPSQLVAVWNVALALHSKPKGKARAAGVKA